MAGTLQPGRRGHFPFVKIMTTVGSRSTSSSVAHEAIMQVRGLFKFTTSQEKEPSAAKMCLLGRWTVPDKAATSRGVSKQPVIKWAIAPPRNRLHREGSEPEDTAWYQIVDIATVMESVTVLPIPRAGHVFRDLANINDDDRLMWVHTIGQSSFGET